MIKVASQNEGGAGRGQGENREGLYTFIKQQNTEGSMVLNVKLTAQKLLRVIYGKLGKLSSCARARCALKVEVFLLTTTDTKVSPFRGRDGAGRDETRDRCQ